MAYSNWGGEVWRDGRALPANCDATIAQALGQQAPYSTYWEHFMQDAATRDWMYHAILGDAEAGLLVGLFKSGIANVCALVDGECLILHSPEIRRIPELAGDSHELWTKDTPLTFSANGLSVLCHLGGVKEGPERVAVSFTDGRGRHWFRVTGYQLGAGFIDEWSESWPSRW